MINIGCNALIPTPGGFWGIECGKGRGLILPGGKWEEGELFSETAVREAREETGIIVRAERLVYCGPSTDGFFVHTYMCRVMDITGLCETTEGKPRVVSWSDLMTSQFRCYYENLRQAYYEKV